MTIKAIRQTDGETIWEVDGLRYEPPTPATDWETKFKMNWAQFILNLDEHVENLIDLLVSYVDWVEDSLLAFTHAHPSASQWRG